MRQRDGVRGGTLFRIFVHGAKAAALSREAELQCAIFSGLAIEWLAMSNPSLLGGNTGGSDHVRPSLDVGAHELGELPGRARDRLQSLA